VEEWKMVKYGEESKEERRLRKKEERKMVKCEKRSERNMRLSMC
jgi:hypothetical protein